MAPSPAGPGPSRRVVAAWLRRALGAAPALRNDGLRAVTNEGAGLAALAPRLALLAGVAGVSFAAALRRFRWP